MREYGTGLSTDELSDPTTATVRLLGTLGWEYLNPQQALALRGGRTDEVLLTDVLRPWLLAHNRFQSKGHRHRFSAASTDEAVRRLRDPPYRGLLDANEQIYHLLTLGTSLDQAVAGDRKGRHLHYIDWARPEHNRYHVTTRFAVDCCRALGIRHLDLVLFVNGIPFAVIACAKHGQDGTTHAADTAMARLLAAQRDDQIPRLFQYAQLLIAAGPEHAKYATVGTAPPFWSRWHEEAENAPASAAANHRQPTALDQLVYALLRPQRLLELVYGYVVFDAGSRKIARYPQYFAVEAALARALQIRQGKRGGGVVWHATGSGKSLTMVMLAKALTQHPQIGNPRIVLVTDRVDLDEQLADTFANCGKSAVRATTGEHLTRLISQGTADVITTVINKFNTVMAKHQAVDASPNLFVLVDEAHRSHYHVTAANMRRVFPNACYIAFTGTPLTRKEKNTAQRFGGFIHRYTLYQAIQDQAVLPLLYEGRQVHLAQDRATVRRWFAHLTQRLSAEQKAAIKHALQGQRPLTANEARIRRIAFDLSCHYRDTLQGSGLKAQLAVESRSAAIRYLRAIQRIGLIKAEVVISPPETSSAADSADDPRLVHRFWDEMMSRFGSEKRYLEEIRAGFARPDGVELLIVVDKLLTGFDEPRNTALYIDRPLKDHTLLQAISRVNRVFPGKPYGLVIDYRGVFGALNKALHTYDALAAFDPSDANLSGALIDTREELARLPQYHAALWALCQDWENGDDIDGLLHRLSNEADYLHFDQALKAYRHSLAIALGTERFHQETPEQRIQTYQDDLRFFQHLHARLQNRQTRARQGLEEELSLALANTPVYATTLERFTPPLRLFEHHVLHGEHDEFLGGDAKVYRTAHQANTGHRATLASAPADSGDFTELLQASMDKARQQRIGDQDPLWRFTADTRQNNVETIPGTLRHHPAAQAYYQTLHGVFASLALPSGAEPEHLAADCALAAERIIGAYRVRDWRHKPDIINAIQNALDDYLYALRDEQGIPLTTESMDTIIALCLFIAGQGAST